MEQKLEILSVYADNLIDRYVKQAHVDTFLQDYYALIKKHKEASSALGNDLFLDSLIFDDQTTNAEKRAKWGSMVAKINLAILIFHVSTLSELETCLHAFFKVVIGPSPFYSREEIDFFFSLKLNVFRKKIDALPEPKDQEVKDLVETFLERDILFPADSPGKLKVLKKNSKMINMLKGFNSKQIIHQNFGSSAEMSYILRTLVDSRYTSIQDGDKEPPAKRLKRTCSSHTISLHAPDKHTYSSRRKNQIITGAGNKHQSDDRTDTGNKDEA